MLLRLGIGYSWFRPFRRSFQRTCLPTGSQCCNWNFNNPGAGSLRGTEILKVRRRQIHSTLTSWKGRLQETHIKADRHKEDDGLSKLTENVWTIPNLLCVARMGMAPVLGYMVINEQYKPALALFVVAGVTDLLDGWIARVWTTQSSVMGSFLDPMADKILVGVLFISLTYMDFIPVALTCLILARDTLLISAGFYIRYKSLDPPRTVEKYFNVTHPTAQLAPTFISKVNTGIQLGLVAATLVSTVIPYDVQSYLEALWYCTATTTIVSGLSYLFVKDTYRFLRRDKKSRKFSLGKNDAKDSPQT